jgi:hypothetical protein
MFSKRVRFQEDQFSRDYEDLTYNDDQVKKRMIKLGKMNISLVKMMTRCQK